MPSINDICKTYGLDLDHKNKYRTTPEDIFVGAEFICIYACANNSVFNTITVGKVYTVKKISAYISMGNWTVSESYFTTVNAYLGDIPEDYPCSIFVPRTKFTDEDMFHLELAGKIDMSSHDMSSHDMSSHDNATVGERDAVKRK